MMSRKTKFTDEKKSKIIRALSLGMTHELAANYAGIGTSTLYRWFGRGREGEGEFVEFWEDCKKAEANNAAGMLGVIMQEAKNSRWQAAAWLLERRHGYKSSMDPIVEINVESETANINQMITDLKGSKELLDQIMGPKIDLDE
jgi:transposase